MARTAVILFNLGGPDGPEAVGPFLYNLFSDPAILRVPAPFRQILARLIAGRRTKIAQEIYAKIGGRSPILENTEAQARALEQILGPDARCFTVMRYWHPFSREVVREVEKFRPEEIIFLPLYPQFSTTTTASSFADFHAALQETAIAAKPKSICCYPEEEGFVQALAESVQRATAQLAGHGKPRLLFSAHGLPEKIVKSGDPYPWQCLRTAKAVANRLEISSDDWVLCYQSRVGPLKWIGPATEDEIRRAGQDKVPVIIVPIAFVSEHSETLVELDIEYRQLAEKSGVPFYVRVPTAGTHPAFIEGLARLVKKASESSPDCLSASGGRICPGLFTGCPAKK